MGFHFILINQLKNRRFFLVAYHINCEKGAKPKYFKNIMFAVKERHLAGDIMSYNWVNPPSKDLCCSDLYDWRNYHKKQDE